MHGPIRCKFADQVVRFKRSLRGRRIIAMKGNTGEIFHHLGGERVCIRKRFSTTERRSR